MMRREGFESHTHLLRSGGRKRCPGVDDASLLHGKSFRMRHEKKSQVCGSFCSLWEDDTHYTPHEKIRPVPEDPVSEFLFQSKDKKDRKHVRGTRVIRAEPGHHPLSFSLVSVLSVVSYISSFAFDVWWTSREKKPPLKLIPRKTCNNSRSDSFPLHFSAKEKKHKRVIISRCSSSDFMADAGIKFVRKRDQSLKVCEKNQGRDEKRRKSR